MKKTLLTLGMVFLGILLIGFQPVSACEYPGCDECPGTGTPGYWKNHPDAWPVTVIPIGDSELTQEQALYYMNRPVKKDKSITLFRAYVAAYLNWVSGCCIPEDPDLPPPDYGCGFDCLCQAEAWLDMVQGPGAGVRANWNVWQHSHGEAIYECLDAYNNGYGCAPSRDSLE